MYRFYLLLFRLTVMNGMSISENRNTLLIVIEIRVPNACGFIVLLSLIVVRSTTRDLANRV